MNWQWTAAGYAAAGLAAAMVPVAFHLLRRRHVHHVQWGPMFLLRQAVTRQRRWLRLRDRMLLLLRMLAILAFGCALARPRPVLTPGANPSDPGTHLILIDNSLSMAYRHLGASRRTLALDKAREILDQLPAGARAMVLPVCDAPGSGPAVRWQRPSEVPLAWEAFPLVERPATLAQVGRRIEELAAYVSPPPQRIYLVTDRQAINRSAGPGGGLPEGLPPVEWVDVGPATAANAWVHRVRLSPPVLVVGQAATVQAEIGAAGQGLPRQMAVHLLVEGRPIGKQLIDTPADGNVTTVDFPVDWPAIPRPLPADGRLEVTARIAPDLLTEDDQWQTLVPVLHTAALICVDQRSADQEDVARAQVGSTFFLRRLLAAFGTPVAAHVTPEQLDPALLRGARLVVVAGVPAPGPLVPMLRDFVADGGQLLIAAGGAFDPRAWNQQGWLDGRGILPAPLGETLATWEPPQKLDGESMRQATALQLPGLSARQQVELADEPLILRSVPIGAGQRAPQGAGQAGRSNVWVRLENGQPLVVERPIGQGRVVLMGTSLEPTWNTWATSNAVLFWEAIVGHMIRTTIEPRHFRVGQPLALVIPASVPGGQIPDSWRLEGSDGDDRDVRLRAIGQGRAMAQLNPFWRRGIYRLVPRSESASQAGIRFAIEPPGEMPNESDLRRSVVSGGKGPASADAASPRLVRARLGGDWAWWYLVWMMLGALLIETLVVGLRRPEAGRPPGGEFEGADGREGWA